MSNYYNLKASENKKIVDLKTIIMTAMQGLLKEKNWLNVVTKLTLKHVQNYKNV